MFTVPTKVQYKLVGHVPPKARRKSMRCQSCSSCTKCSGPCACKCKGRDPQLGSATLVRL